MSANKYVLVVRRDNKNFLTRCVYDTETLIDILEEMPEKSCIRVYKLSHKKN